MDKIDFKKRDRALYHPPTGQFVPVDVPPLPYLMVDGRGDPNTAPAYLQAVQWLYSVSTEVRPEGRRPGLRGATAGSALDRRGSVELCGTPQG